MIIDTGGRTDTVNYYSDWLPNVSSRAKSTSAIRSFRTAYTATGSRPHLPQTVPQGDPQGVFVHALARHRGLRHLPQRLRIPLRRRRPDSALENYRRHDPRSPLLAGGLQPSETLCDGVQERWTAEGEPTLF